MTSSSSQSAKSPLASSSFDALAPYSQQIGFGLIAAGVLLGAIPVVNAFLYRWHNPPLLIWGGFISLLTIGAGVWYLMPRVGLRVGEADVLRLITLALGGLGGFATALFGLALPILQYREELSGGLQAWRENRVPLSLSALAFLGGLVLMFLGLMQARTFERTRPALRRLLYGYNAVLGGLLLLCILALLNILPYSPVWPLSLLGKPLDLTSSGQYTLQPATIAMVNGVTKPVKIYVLITDRDGLDEQTAVLLDQCRSANGLFSWETVSRDLNADKWRELEKNYKIPGGGMLVVYGTQPDESFEHIKSSDLWKSNMRRDGTQQSNYKGEYALMSALTSLYEGKSRPVVYFTQGNGELTLQNMGIGDRSQSMSMFIEELGKSNYDLKPLQFDRKALSQSKSVPDDAEVVVVAGPQTPLTQEAIEALRKYVQTPRGPKCKKGKLIVLLDTVVDQEKKTMMKTNLEPLLLEHNVEVGNNYVAMRMENTVSKTVVAVVNPANKSPMGAAFTNRQGVALFRLNAARTVKPGRGDPRGGGAQAEVLLASYPNTETWAEGDLVTPLVDIVRALDKKSEEPDYQQLALGVTVTESGAAAELPMGHPSTEQTPRMVVIGNARWLADDSEPKFRRTNVALFSSCLSWLRERPDIGAPPEDKDRPTYTLSLPDVASARRLLFLPGALMILAIVTLGGGVWVVRRR